MPHLRLKPANPLLRSVVPIVRLKVDGQGRGWTASLLREGLIQEEGGG